MRDRLVPDLAKAAKKKQSKAGQVRRSSATLLTWDASQLRGSVDWNGTVIHDIPLLGAIDAFGWQAGDEVVIDTIPGTGGGFSSPMILGRVFRPGAANSAKVLQTLQSEVVSQIIDEIVQELIESPAGQDLVKFVIGGTVFTATVDTSESRTLTSYGDLATVGPVVADVPISDVGKAVVFLAASTRATVAAGASFGGGFMSVRVSGATTVEPDPADVDAFALTGSNQTGAGTGHTVSVRAASSRVLDGLNPGTHTFTAKYRAFSATSTVTFSSRALIVIAL